MEIQKPLRLSISKTPGEPSWLFRERTRELNGQTIRTISREKLYSDLLKRQARRVMNDITECPPGTIAAHLARLNDLREIIQFAVNHEFKDSPESRLSAAQLMYPETLVDFLGCLEITRKEHRAPAFLNSRDEDLAKINHKLDLLAGLFAKSPALSVALESEEE